MAGTIDMDGAAYLDFLAEIDRSALSAPEDGIVVSHVTQLVRGWTFHVTTRQIAQTPEASVAATYTRWPAGAEPQLDKLRVTVCQQGTSRMLGADVLAACGIPDAEARYLGTGTPVRTKQIEVDRPLFPDHSGSAFAAVLDAMLPTVMVLVRTDDRAIARRASRAVPPALRPVIPVLMMDGRFATACDQVLRDRGIAPLEPETVCVLVLGAQGLSEEYRTPGLRRLEGRRLARRLESAAELVGEQVKTFFEGGEVRLVEDPEIRELAEHAAETDRELEAARAENQRLRGALSHAQEELVRERRLVRDLVHEAEQASGAAASARPAATDEAAPRPGQDGREVPAAPRPVPCAAEPSPAPVFDSFADLLAHAAATLPLVLLSETVWAPAAELDMHAKAAVWRGRTWDALASMQEYAARRAAGDAAPSLRAWLEEHPSPRLPPTSVATGETAYTSSTGTLREARVFPVPPEVAPTGRAFMGPHVRIEPGGTRPTPRLHFLDDTAATGRLYVGYIGEHLPTRRGA